MANLPGLTPQGQRPQPGRPLQGRPEVTPNIPQVAFRATTSPVDTMLTPVLDRGAGSGALALAQGLGQISPVLARVADEAIRREEEEQAVLAGVAIEGMSTADALKGMQDGTLTGWDNPIYRAAFKKLYGQRLALDYQRDTLTAYETEFDKQGGDIGQFLAQRTAQATEGETDKFILAGFGQYIGRINEGINAAHRGEVNKRVHGQALDNLFTKFDALAAEGIGKSWSPATITAVLQGQYRDTQAALGVTPEELDGIVFNVAAKLAEGGHKDTVAALLNTDRADGSPAISRRQEYGTKALRLIELAETKQREKAREAQTDVRADLRFAAGQGSMDDAKLKAATEAGAFTVAEAETLRVQNASVAQAERERAERAAAKQALEDQSRKELDTIISQGLAQASTGGLYGLLPRRYHTKTGEVAVLTSEEYRKAVIAKKLEESQVTARLNNETPEQTFNRDLAWFVSNGAVNDQWADILNSGYRSANNPTLDWRKPGDIPQPLANAYALYLKMDAAAPQALSGHLTNGDAWDFYEAMKIGQEDGMTLDQAYGAALTVTRDPDLARASVIDVKPKDLEGRLKGLDGNYTQAAGPIGKRASFYVRLGFTPQEALDKAVERFEATHTIVLGNYIPVGRMGQPPNLKELLEETVDAFAFAYADSLNVGKDDLTVTALDNAATVFQIVDRTTGTRVLNLPGARFTVADLVEAGKRREALRRDAEQARITRANEDRYKPYAVGRILGVPYSIGPGSSTPEEKAKIDEERRKALEEYDRTSPGLSNLLYDDPDTLEAQQ